MTSGQDTELTPQAAAIGEAIQSLVKALRAFQMYLANNPIYQRAIANVRSAFAPVWEHSEEIALHIAETDFVWEEQVVYRQPHKGESLAWWLFKDGMRSLILRRGVENEEIVRFLEMVNRARFLPADAGDDLLTLLWEQEYGFIDYRFAEAFGDEPLPGAGGDGAAPAHEGPSSPAERKSLVQEEAPPRPKGVVDIEDFDSTLYFLDESEIQYIITEVKTEYARDARGAALDAMYDIFESQPNVEVRREIISVIDGLFPNLLNQGDFRTVASVLRETRQLAQRSTELTPELRHRLMAFDGQLSQPEIVRQLMQVLDEASTRPDEADVAELLRELQPAALEAILVALPLLSSDSVRRLLEVTADRLATSNSGEVLRLLRLPQSEALPAVVTMCGRLQLQGAVPGLGEALGHSDANIRLAAVKALNELGTPSALTHLERAIDDGDRNVRLAAVRAAGARGYKGALRRVEAVVLGKTVKDLDLTEKMAFFESYGAIAGGSALKTLEALLLSRKLFRFRAEAETRACAAIALGKLRSAEARAVLQQATEDKELVVRNAVSRALREAGA